MLRLRRRRTHSKHLLIGVSLIVEDDVEEEDKKRNVEGYNKRRFVVRRKICTHLGDLRLGVSCCGEGFGQLGASSKVGGGWKGDEALDVRWIRERDDEFWRLTSFRRDTAKPAQARLLITALFLPRTLVCRAVRASATGVSAGLAPRVGIGWMMISGEARLCWRVCIMLDRLCLKNFSRGCAGGLSVSRFLPGIKLTVSFASNS